MALNVAAALAARGVEARFHALLTELCGGEVDYLRDIEASDLEGRTLADGEAIAAPVARGLVRKLRQEPVPALDRDTSDRGAEEPAAEPMAEPDTETGAAAPVAVAMPAAASGSCAVTLLRGPAGGPSAGLVRCGFRAELLRAGARRRKVLAVVLDRSGSMAGAMWRRVVEGVVGVVSDDLQADPLMSVAVVVYADQATEVPLTGRSSDLRDRLLSRDLAPQGGTCFRAAFERTELILRRELQRHVTAAAGASPSDVDLGVLIFTDGEDTSVKGAVGQYGVRLVDRPASSAAARAAGDAFRAALRATGSPSHVCIAAFGADHDPDQCQYLSDRYYYINRGEVLSDVLAVGLGAILSSAGHCELRLSLPSGASAAEPLPKTLPLDAAGLLDHHLWLEMPAGCRGQVSVHLSGAGEGSAVAVGHCEASDASVPDPESFEGHLLKLDLAALHLRRVARELCAKRPTVEELAPLRARLAATKDSLAHTKTVASAACGQLRGRAALRERLAEVEALRERLSYALGHFDEHDQDTRQIGAVAVDAILRDAGQHVPQGAQAAALARRAEAVASLPPSEPLSRYGRGYTTDAYSCCDARELADQGDAAFFQLRAVRSPAESKGPVIVEDGDGFVSHEAFLLLSKGATQPVRTAEGDGSFTHVGLPLYVTAGHFMRARFLLPEVLRRLTVDGSYVEGTSERLLLGLLGQAVAAAGRQGSEVRLVALLHKARGVHAALAAVKAPGVAEGSLLQAVLAEALRFVDEPASRTGVEDLWALAGVGMLASDWPEGKLNQLCSAIVEESLRRSFAAGLHGVGEAQRLWLVWALLVPDSSAGGRLGDPEACGAWLDRTLAAVQAPLRLSGGGFDPLTAADQLEAPETSPGPREAGVCALAALLKRGRANNAPAPGDLAALRLQLAAYARVAQQEGGLPALWSWLDDLMTKEGTEHEAALHRHVAALRVPAQDGQLRGALEDGSGVALAAAAVALGGDGAAAECATLRAAAAKQLRALVTRRAELAKAHPITGATFPRLATSSASRHQEIWGAAAEPTDGALHRQARQAVLERHPGLPLTVREALTEKEYRSRGGVFVFPAPLDTFIPGLHRRTQDLHGHWRAKGRKTAGAEARQAAVTEMLLRLRWEDGQVGAREQLSAILARIWDGLEGVDLSKDAPVPSALWLKVP